MGRVLRVMTWNIHAAVGTEGGYDLRRIADLINAQRPDLVGLQEVDRRYSPRSGFDDQPALLATLTGLEPCYGPTLESAGAGGEGGQYGSLILSRLPLLATAATLLPSALEQRGLIEAVVDLGDAGRVAFFNVHLGLGDGPAERLPQAMAVAGRLDAASAPRILVGDLNVQPPAPELAPLLDRLGDVWPEAGSEPGATIPSTGPLWRIDLVLAERSLRPLRAWTVPTDASDHLPVICDLELPARGMDM